MSRKPSQLRWLIVFFATAVFSEVGFAQWIEAWNSSTVGPYTFDADGVAYVPGDRGAWVILDTSGEPTGNQVSIESIAGNKRLRLVCTNGGGLQASLLPLNIAITSGTRLAITQTGVLINPAWNGA